jgi:hypothetical protein
VVTLLTKPIDLLTGDTLLDGDDLALLTSGLTVANDPSDPRIAKRRSLVSPPPGPFSGRPEGARSRPAHPPPSPPRPLPQFEWIESEGVKGKLGETYVSSFQQYYYPRERK